MNKVTGSLGVVLGMSLLATVIAIARGGREERPGPVPPPYVTRTGPVADVAAAERASFPSEVQQFRLEPATPRERRSGTDSMRWDGETAALLREGRAMDAFWNDLEELLEMSRHLPEGRFQSLGIRLTAEFLGFTGSQAEAFEGVASVVVDLLTEARWVLEAQGSAIDPSPEALQSYEERVKAAVALFEPHLNSGWRHRQFKTEVERWGAHFVVPAAQQDE